LTPERWQEVEKVFRAALVRTPNSRKLFLEERCAGDSDLRREVASLLTSHDEAGSFLDAPPAVDVSTADVHTFLPGQLVAERFRIVRFLAEGGMGEVYEAFDTVQNETVALKTIRQTILDDEEAERRLVRESQLARKVSHSNVCRIYDLFHHTVRSGNSEARIQFLTMELLSGETLSQRLRRLGPLTVERALPIARQIAGALKAAHDVGVVHRDLKPDNVILVSTKRGVRPVVTDFGLARENKVFEGLPKSARGDLLWILHGLQADEGLEPKRALARLAKRARRQMVALGLVSDDETALTELGRIMGTPAYMSPEQARGDRADERSDLWSFGVVFYQMLTGKLPYRPESSFRGLIRKLTARRRTPSALRRRVPSPVRRVIYRCLEVSRLDRYQTADDLISDLDSAASKPSPRARLVRYFVLALVALLAAWLALELL
jgi:serine/threonine protein kinase